MPIANGRQQYLDLGGRANFDLLHGGHSADITLAAKGAQWTEATHRHDDAAVIAGAMRGYSDRYMGQNGFAGRRGIETATALTSCFADLDTYNVSALSGLTVDGLLDLIQAAHPWLPVPTVVVSSGRGFYVYWRLGTVLTHSQLPRWQSVQDALVGVLAHLGADMNARDAARVLRMAETINSKSGAMVIATQTGRIVAFDKFERLVLRHALPSPSRLVLVADNPDVQRAATIDTSSAAQRRQHVVGYQLAFDRMQDCATIARLRGSPTMRDYRHRLLYLYSIFGSWFWSDRAQAERELTEFARMHFADAGLYGPQLVQTVLERMEQGKRGMRGIYKGAGVDRRYRMQNRTIISLLDLTPAEQSSLKTIIGTEERRKRRAARRLAAGMESYADRTAKRTVAILEARAGGLTQAEIADELDISQQAVSKLLKQHRQAGGG